MGETQAEFDHLLRYGRDDHNRHRTSGAAKRVTAIQRLWADAKDIEGFGFEDRAVLERFVLKCCVDGFEPRELSPQEKLYVHNLCYNIPTQIVYQKPEVVKAPQQQQAAVDPKDWRTFFRKPGELEDGGTKMLVRGLIPEGTNFIGGLPGHAKTWLALSIAKGLVTGNSIFGCFEVPEKQKVLYLVPEASGRAFKQRLFKFGIPDDGSFLCRTLSEGVTIRLNDPILLECVKQMRPVIFLDTAIRFSTSADENSSADNQELVNDIVRLRQLGSPAVIGLHHATKSSRAEEINLENSLRGTSDLGAMCDSVYAIRRDEKLYDNGNGPLEFEVLCVKARDFDNPKPFRIAATCRNEIGALVSAIDKGDFVLVDKSVEQFDQDSKVARMVDINPQIGLREIGDSLGYSKDKVLRVLTRLGYKKQNGKWVVGQSAQPEDEEDHAKEA